MSSQKDDLYYKNLVRLATAQTALKKSDEARNNIRLANEYYANKGDEKYNSPKRVLAMLTGKLEEKKAA